MKVVREEQAISGRSYIRRTYSGRTAEILGEELLFQKLNQEEKRKTYLVIRLSITGIRPVGPESLRHFKRTYKEALKRQLISGQYNYETPIIIQYVKTRDTGHINLCPCHKPML